MDKIIVTVSGVGLIIFIYWFFFGKKDEAAVADVAQGGGSINIKVDGGYSPSVIKIKNNETTTLKILRKDPNSCLEEIVLPDFKVSKFLPLKREIEIKITPQKRGEFPFHCGMNMFHGKVIVE